MIPNDPLFHHNRPLNKFLNNRRNSIMTMANYKLNLRLSEQQLNILYDALQYYSTMSESMVDSYSSQDVDALFEEVSNLYLEEESEHRLDPAAQAFVEQYGREELLSNSERWKGFKTAYDLLHESNCYDANTANQLWSEVGERLEKLGSMDNAKFRVVGESLKQELDM